MQRVNEGDGFLSLLFVEVSAAKNQCRSAECKQKGCRGFWNGDQESDWVEVGPGCCASICLRVSSGTQTVGLDAEVVDAGRIVDGDQNGCGVVVRTECTPREIGGSVVCDFKGGCVSQNGEGGVGICGGEIPA